MAFNPNPHRHPVVMPLDTNSNAGWARELADSIMDDISDDVFMGASASMTGGQ